MQELTQQMRDTLSKEVECDQITLHVTKIHDFTKEFGKYIQKSQKWQQAGDNLKSICLNIQQPFPSEFNEFITTNNCTISQCKIKITYKDLSYNEVLQQLIPITPPQGFEMIGKIAHFNLSQEQLPYKYIIGQVLLDKNKQIETVCNKIEKLHNVYRTPTLELMAGKNCYDALVPEGGIRMHLNFEKVYWCTRLYSERDRVINLVQELSKQPKILDLFCGIGPFSLRIAKQLNVQCYANDLNPFCYQYLQKNIITNNLQMLIKPFNLDAKDIMLQYYDKLIQFEFNHVYMNLPVLAMDFLSLFKGFTTKSGRTDLPYIHVYGFAKGASDNELIDVVVERIGKYLPGFKKENIIRFHVVKNVTKMKKMVCVSFQLDKLSAESDFDFKELDFGEVSDEENEQIDDNVQKKQILFDVQESHLNLKPGEKVFIHSKEVEDTKGNPGQLGVFQGTNIRVMWYSPIDPNINLSVGLGTVFHVEQRGQNSFQGALQYSMILRTKMKNSRYEFNFNTNQKSVFDGVQTIINNYQKFPLFREIKVSFVMTSQNNLIIQPKEKIINKYSNVYSISNDKQDFLGTIFLTNVRFAWFSTQNELFNISVPWISIKKLTKKTIKSSLTIVIETYSEFSGCIIGYRSTDTEKIFKEIESLYKAFIENPIYGVEYLQQNESIIQQQQPQFKDEELQLLESNYNTKSTYQINQGNNEDCEIIFSKELGLAIEKLPENLQLTDLWNVISI